MIYPNGNSGGANCHKFVSSPIAVQACALFGSVWNFVMAAMVRVFALFVHFNWVSDATFGASESKLVAHITRPRGDSISISTLVLPRIGHGVQV